MDDSREREIAGVDSNMPLSRQDAGLALSGSTDGPLSQAGRQAVSWE